MPAAVRGMGDTPGQARKRFLVCRIDPSPALDAGVESAELCPSEGSQKVGKAIVVSHGGVLVVGEGLPGLRRQMTGPFGQLLATRSRASRPHSW